MLLDVGSNGLWVRPDTNSLLAKCLLCAQNGQDARSMQGSDEEAQVSHGFQ